MFRLYQYEYGFLLYLVCKIWTCSDPILTDYARKSESFRKMQIQVKINKQSLKHWDIINSCLYFVWNVADSSSNYTNNSSLATILVNLISFVWWWHFWSHDPLSICIRSPWSRWSYHTCNICKILMPLKYSHYQSMRLWSRQLVLTFKKKDGVD